MISEQRRRTRRNLSYYMPVLDAKTKKPRGIMTNISMGGFRLDSREPIPPGQFGRFRLNLTNDIAPNASLEFAGRSKWCRPDTYEPSTFNVGFEIVNISPDDVFIYRRVFEKCGTYTSGVEINKGDYLWK